MIAKCYVGRKSEVGLDHFQCFKDVGKSSDFLSAAN